MRDLTTSLTDWLVALNPGVRVGVYERSGTHYLNERIVANRTPTGRIVCVGGSTFKSDGYNYVPRGSAYADRRIMPIPEST